MMICDFRESRPTATRPPSRRRGYSFPEVLFAVVVLGIGFIMIAAIFPVAIQQAKVTADETAAAAVARSGFSVMTELAYDPRDPASVTPPLPPMLPHTAKGTTVTNPGEVLPIMTVHGWRSIRGSLIVRGDPRYAFVPLYRRGITVSNGVLTPNGTAQLYIIGVQCPSTGRQPARTEAEFDQFDVGRDTTPNPPLAGADAVLTRNPNNLRPRRIEVNVKDDPQGVDLLRVKRQVNTTSLMTENLPDAVATGAYIITGDDGAIYRVGLRREDLDDATHYAWELQPGSDLRSNLEDTPGGGDEAAWCVGRERQGDGTFIGPAQDISIYTARIQVKP